MCSRLLLSLQRDVLEAFGFIVAVDFLQLAVEQLREERRVFRRTRELDEPLVPATGVVVHEHGSGGVFQHFGAGFAAGEGQALFGIVDDQFFTEGVDEVLRPAGDDELVRILGGETDRVADQVAPQAAASGDDHRVILSGLDAPERHDGGVLLPEVFHRDEFVEDAVVERQAHGRIGRVILEAEETLAGIVRFHIMHLGRGDQALVLGTVGREGHAAVEEDLEIGPDLFQMRLAGQFHHTRQDRHHPGRNTADVGDVLVHGLAGDAVALDLEVGDQRRLLFGDTHQVGDGIDVFEHDGAHVAYQRVLHVVVRGVAAAQDERLAVEDATFRMIVKVIGKGIESTLVVGFLQALGTYGDELRLVGRCAGRFGIPLHGPGPEDVALSVPHPVDAALEFLISVDRAGCREIFVGADRSEAVLLPVLGTGGPAHQKGERLPLGGVPFCPLTFQLPRPRREYQSCKSGQTHRMDC